jgi:FAD:protein FMN transferase
MDDWSTTTFAALGTTAVLVVTEPDALDEVTDLVSAVIADVDHACSRFRDDSELMVVNRAGGRAVAVSPTLRDTLAIALSAAQATDGLVDPTVGDAVRVLGYDRDFQAIERIGPPARLRVARVPGWQAVNLAVDAGTVVVPRGVQLDLGATAKAWCADRAAALAAAATGAGVLVSLGGDVAVAGPPPEDGWIVRIADRHDAPAGDGGPMVAIQGGGLATSGTAARRWWRGYRALHHIVDPSTGQPPIAWWRTVSVAAGSCVDANVAATAAIVLGPAARAWLEARLLPARLAHEDGTVQTVCGWPDDEAGVVARRSA